LSVTFTASDASSTCDKWIQTRGQAGEFWSRNPDEATTDREIVCIFRHRDGGRVEIDDSGGQYLAQSVCAAFAGEEGWSEDVEAEDAAKEDARRAQQKAEDLERVRDLAGRIAGDINGVRQAIADLKRYGFAGDLRAIKQDVNLAYSDLQRTLRDSADMVCTDATQVGTDEVQVEGDQVQLESDGDLMDMSTQAVSDAVAQLKSDWAALQAARQDAPGAVPLDTPSASDVQAAVADASPAIDAAKARRARAYGKAADLVAEAKRYSSQADAACSRVGGG
jgi:hypothetical protein